MKNRKLNVMKFYDDDKKVFIIMNFSLWCSSFRIEIKMKII